MGEKDGEKSGGENKAAETKDDGKLTVVLKTELHCEGCAKKVRRAVRNFDGVEGVKTDYTANKVTVTGKVDPTEIKEKLEQKIKKKVELVSPQPKKDGGGDKKPAEKAEKKEEPKKEEPKKPIQSTVVYKIKLHCEGCINKIRRVIKKYDGVETVEIEGPKDQVTVKGTMDVNELTPYLRTKLKRSVDVVPPKKEEGGGEKKEKEGGGGGGDKKEKEGGGGGGGDKKEKEGGGDKKEKEKEGGGGDGGKKEEAGAAPKVEVNKMVYGGYPYAPNTTYWYDGQVDGQHNPVEVHQGYVNNYTPYGYGNQGYVDPGHGYNMVPHPHPMHAPQMFSDENPNACSIM
ncbi:heavy metal-associated isoprenylated plant protein 5-like [Fagus crenata]